MLTIESVDHETRLYVVRIENRTLGLSAHGRTTRDLLPGRAGGMGSDRNGGSRPARSIGTAASTHEFGDYGSDGSGDVVVLAG